MSPYLLCRPLVVACCLSFAPAVLAEPVVWHAPEADPERPPEAAAAAAPEPSRLSAPLLPADLGSEPFFMLSLDGAALFSADDGTGRCLWRSDGSAEGTYPLLDAEVCLRPMAAASEDGAGAYVAGVVSPSSFNVWELWFTDGTLAGTRTLARFDGTGASLTHALLPLTLTTLGDGRGFFFAWEEAHGYEPWATDGTVAGTRRLEIVPGPAGVDPLSQARIGDELALALRPWGDVYELWKSDGTAEGTVPVVAPLPWVLDEGFPGRMRSLGERAVFLRVAPECSVESAGELWVTDGTAAGTLPLATSIRCTQSASQPFLADGRAFYVQRQADGSFELLATDGTAAGTRLATDFAAAKPFHDHFPLNPRPAWWGGALYLPADGSDGAGEEIWRADPATRATARVADLCPGACSSSVYFFGPIGDRLLFSANDGTHGFEPWSFDAPGTPPRLLADLCPGACDSQPVQFATLAPAGGLPDFWFGARPTGNGFDLYHLSPGAAPLRLTHVGDAGGLTGSTLGLAGDRVLFAANDGVHGSEPWVSDGSPGGTRMLADVAFGPEACAGDTALACLGAGDRFVVRALYHDHHNGGEGQGRSLPAAGSSRSGFFWFFRPDNVELVVKVLDGSAINGHYWSFYGALSDVEYWVVVEDRELGTRRIYHNPPGEFCGRGDTTSLFAPPAFAGTAAPTATRAEAGAGWQAVAFDAVTDRRPAPLHPPEQCTPDAETLCLADGRFRVRVAWQDQHNGGSGVGGALPFSERSGFFWFFRPDNVELVVKVLDGRAINGKFWVFYGALSDVGYELEVFDVVEGHSVRRYVNPPGNLCGQADTAAF